jgi:hypothetical protein
MSEKSNPSFQEARDRALRTLITNAGLTPDQVSVLRLNQVHLATSTLVIAPDEFDLSSEGGGEPVSLHLDQTMQRALIAWLVARPDGPNDHLFPGEGLAGLDVATINEIVAPAKPAEAAEPEDSVDIPAAPRIHYREPDKLAPEAAPADSQPVTEKEPSPAPPAAEPTEKPRLDPLDEIESLRQRLAETYDAWAPAVSIPPKADVDREAEILSALLDEEEARVAPELPPEPVAPPLEEEELVPATPLPEDARKSMPDAAPGPVSASDTLKRLWRVGGAGLTLNFSYRAAVLSGLALVFICCVGLVVVGGALLSEGGLAGLMASATPSPTPALAEAVSSATFTPSPTSTPTVAATATLVPTPSDTPGGPITPTDTPAPLQTTGPTATPVIVVVTATPTPEPPVTATPVPTDTPVGGTATEPTATATPAFKYSAPVPLEPEDDSVVPGVIAILKWESVGPLADNEWYAVRLIFLQQGQSVYNGDRTKEPEWKVPVRFYYQADGPALEYRWFVFVERDNADGSTTKLSPDSETSVFRWE